MNARISEKWFYTHMKTGHPSLPRIDMLNLLSKYAGYANWDDFLHSHRVEVPAPVSKVNPNRYFYLVPLIALLIVVAFYGLFKLFNTREYTFRIYDADTREPVTGNNIGVRFLPAGESPVDLVCDTTGYFRLKTDRSRIRMVISAPYYLPDTISRILK